ncbi:MAG: glycyl-tRNA synthetase beta chain, partial [Sphingomonadales bacterium]|nr:glycyl-tRNA synthetase beta chain [Sphingomonadales bacterium]
MSDFLLELLSEEIPARMQAKACRDLHSLLETELQKAGLAADKVETYATPRRLALIARNLPAETEAVREETKGPRTSAPPQALEGFLRKTGLTQDGLVERDGTWFAIVDRPGRATASVLAEAVPAIIRAFPWPKSMRWGEASASTESLRWVRPLQGIVALLGEEIVDFEIAGICSGAATVGHRFHHPGVITIGSAADYVEKLRACHVVLDPAERRRIIAEGAAAAAREAGLSLVEDEGLLAENAGLTEWPMPLLGRFDPAFLDVPREVIQLTMRTNQKYFACVSSAPSLRDGEGDHAQHGGGVFAESSTIPLHQPSAGPPPQAALGEESLAPNFVCVANIEAADGGAAIVGGNERVLSARLADARFFWEQDLKVPLEEQAGKLSQIVFHEKLGTVADKVERVAKLARWLVEEGIVGGSSPSTAASPRHSRESGNPATDSELDSRFRGNGEEDASSSRPHLADLAERAARLCKADLVTQMVGEFPELQGVIGGHLARAQGEDPQVADAIRDHYKPVGQGDETPAAPVTVAVSLADKLDSIVAFFAGDMPPSGSRDPYALRRSALGSIDLIGYSRLRLGLYPVIDRLVEALFRNRGFDHDTRWSGEGNIGEAVAADLARLQGKVRAAVLAFFADRLKVQQREAGVRHDLIDAVFALGGEDDLVRLLARVRALQAFVETPEGADLLAGYKRAANILKKEGWAQSAGMTDPAPAEPEQATNNALANATSAEENALI